jgi:acyl-CoA reductase-like NAD-dependent aldehyde dehydrogenase
MGAMVDETQMNRVLGYIEAGAKEGAKLAFGGKRVRSDTGGYYIEPTLFDGVKNSMKIAQEEIFGPVLSTIIFKDEQEAVKLGNDFRQRPHLLALRRLQAVGLRPRQVAARDGQIHPAQGDLDQYQLG